MNGGGQPMTIVRGDCCSLPVPIAKMEPGFFWCRPDALGLAESDAEAIRSGSATDAQLHRAHFHMTAARNALAGSTPNEPVRRPS